MLFLHATDSIHIQLVLGAAVRTKKKKKFDILEKPDCLKNVVKNVSHSKLSDSRHGVSLSATRLAVRKNTTCQKRYSKI